MGFVDKAKTLIRRNGRGAASADDRTDGDAKATEDERTTSSDELLSKAKAAVDKLLE